MAWVGGLETDALDVKKTSKPRHSEIHLSIILKNACSASPRWRRILVAWYLKSSRQAESDKV